MTKQKEPVFMARKATKKDLKQINKKFSGQNKKFGLEDLEKLIVMEANGKLIGLHVSDSNTQNFFE